MYFKYFQNNLNQSSPQVTGGFCALLGVFILTLPIPIVVNSFASYYKNRLWRNEVAHKRSEKLKEQEVELERLRKIAKASGCEDGHVHKSLLFQGSNNV